MGGARRAFGLVCLAWALIAAAAAMGLLKLAYHLIIWVFIGLTMMDFAIEFLLRKQTQR
jgi:hypothetical protein